MHACMQQRARRPDGHVRRSCDVSVVDDGRSASDVVDGSNGSSADDVLREKLSQYTEVMRRALAETQLISARYEQLSLFYRQDPAA